MKVVIFGSRSIYDYNEVKACLDEYHKSYPITEVVCGGAKGPDTFGEIWAKLNGIPYTKFIPEWARLGAGAGITRNIQMADYAHRGIGFWDTSSNGTRHMIDALEAREKPCTIWRLVPPKKFGTSK